MSHRGRNAHRGKRNKGKIVGDIIKIVSIFVEEPTLARLKTKTMKTDSFVSAESAHGFQQLESKCHAAFDMGGPYWHICTDGNKQEIIFSSAQDYVPAMNVLALALHNSGASMLAFIFMNNHIHFIMEGAKDACLLVFQKFKKKRANRHLVG